MFTFIAKGFFFFFLSYFIFAFPVANHGTLFNKIHRVAAPLTKDFYAVLTKHGGNFFKDVKDLGQRLFSSATPESDNISIINSAPRRIYFQELKKIQKASGETKSPPTVDDADDYTSEDRQRLQELLED